MFGAVIRVTAGWAGAQLFLAVMTTFTERTLPFLSDGTLIQRSITGVVEFLPLIVTIAALLVLVQAGLAERRAV
jgi:hypothetical protein